MRGHYLNAGGLQRREGVHGSVDPQAQKQLKTPCVGLGRGRGATDGGRGRAMACRETPGLIRIRLVLRRRAPGARLVEAFETQKCTEAS